MLLTSATPNSSAAIASENTLLIDSRGNSVPDYLKKRVSISFENANLVDALEKIESEFNLRFNYKLDILPDNFPISITIINEPIIIVLNKIFQRAKIDVVITKTGEIVLIEKNQKEVKNKRKKFTINGFVTEKKSGEALIGSNIFIEELSTGTATNSYGFYSITIPEGLCLA